MESHGNKIQEQLADEETVILKISKQKLEFVDFYAEIGSTDRNALLTEIITERLRVMKEQVKALPYIEIPELW